MQSSKVKRGGGGVSKETVVLREHNKKICFYQLS